MFVSSDIDLAQILSEVLEEVRLSVDRDIIGADLLYSLLSAPWLYSLLRVYECLEQHSRNVPNPCLPHASRLCQELMSSLRGLPAPSSEAQELYALLKKPHMQELLSAHDSVAQRDYAPVLPAVPNEMSDNEEAVRIVCLVKNKQPLKCCGEGKPSHWNSLRRFTMEKLALARQFGSEDQSPLPSPGDLSSIPVRNLGSLSRYQSIGSCNLCCQTTNFSGGGLNQSSPAVCDSVMLVDDEHYKCSPVYPRSWCSPGCALQSQTAPCSPIFQRHRSVDATRSTHPALRFTKQQSLDELRSTVCTVANSMDTSTSDARDLRKKMVAVTEKMTDNMEDNAQALSLLVEVVDKLQDLIIANKSPDLSRTSRAHQRFQNWPGQHIAPSKKSSRSTPNVSSFSSSSSSLSSSSPSCNVDSPNGATIKKDPKTGNIFIARVIHGGLADRSGLLLPGDRLLEVNGQKVSGMPPEQVINILVQSEGNILLKVIPNSPQPINNQATLYVRAMVDYSPLQDPAIPCPDVGMAFSKGDLLEIVDQRDNRWWQARKLYSASMSYGLIPSTNQFRHKQRELWWSQPYQAHTCIRPCTPPALTSTHIQQLELFKVLVAIRILLSLPSLQPDLITLKKLESELSILMDSSCPQTITELIKSLDAILSADDLGEVEFMDEMRCTETDEEDFEFVSEEGENGEHMQGLYIAGFRHSLRVWRRKAYSKQNPSCYSCSINSCHNILANLYEDVVHFQPHIDDPPRLIVLIGSSGVGVNELRRRLIKINPNTYQGPVSHTTRPQHLGEKNGREYHFVTKEVFAFLVVNHKFFEYGEHNGHMYGTSFDSVKDVVDSGKICVIDLEPHCINSVRTKKLKPYIIFVRPPSPESMRQTRKDPRFLANSYIKRYFQDKDFEEIVEASRAMEAKYRQFFDCVIVNKDLQDSCMDLFTAIQHAQEEPQWIPSSWFAPDGS
ncbi:hypothetical protein DNTS_034391 [Danionella cerebrum]|uniref:MAGUK p55 subfamily member 4 n=1 Tax=Danionella cerebrum TaxID=2873325 RepID=A0A553Q1A7_9TELE|nr:hypothetical protein DNTS_034391 [Danionella translucida]